MRVVQLAEQQCSGGHSPLWPLFFFSSWNRRPRGARIALTFFYFYSYFYFFATVILMPVPLRGIGELSLYMPSTFFCQVFVEVGSSSAGRACVVASPLLQTTSTAPAAGGGGGMLLVFFLCAGALAIAVLTMFLEARRRLHAPPRVHQTWGPLVLEALWATHVADTQHRASSACCSLSQYAAVLLPLCV